VIDNTLALGGRSLRLRTPLAAYEEVFLPLHGAHQGDNAAIALTAVESFFDAPLSPDVIEEGFADVRMPGRFEVVGHQPLVILDGAHNPAGALACAQTLEDDFEPAGDRVYVVGMLRGRDPEEMLSSLGAEQARILVACSPQSPRAMSAEEVAKAAESLGVSEVYVIESVSRAVDRAVGLANPDDAVLISGSLYVVGEARAKLVKK